MNGLWHLVLSVGVGLVWMIVLRGRQSLRGTTLVAAWNWSVLAALCWSVTLLSERLGSGLSPQVADHAWYACAVLALCPPIAVLGSRKPGTHVWTFFILVPMLLVLGWPGLTLWLQGTHLRGLQLETPQLVAYGLVLVMGVGNYCGTRFTIAALLYGAAALAVVVSSSAISPDWLSERTLTRAWSTCLMIVSIVSIRFSTRPIPTTKFDRLWFDFFDTFGIVWGRRIQDRVNFVAKREGWQSRLELDGFVILRELPPAHSQISQITDAGPRNIETMNVEELNSELRTEYVLRWLLRRFVDPQWIDQRVGTSLRPDTPNLTIDS